MDNSTQQRRNFAVTPVWHHQGMKTPSTLLKAQRNTLGLSLRELALPTGIDWRRLSDFELGLRRPDADQAERLAQALSLQRNQVLEVPIPFDGTVEKRFRERHRWRVPADRPTSVRVAAAYAKYPEVMRRLAFDAPPWAETFMTHLVCGSAEELLHWQHCFTIDPKPARVRPQVAGYVAKHVVDPLSGESVGMHRFHCLVIKGLLFIPQVSVKINKQTFTMDALVKVGKTWVNLEIDGPGHDTSRDALRTAALDMPTIRWNLADLLSLDYGTRLVGALESFRPRRQPDAVPQPGAGILAPTAGTLRQPRCPS
jgi:hypothetical protein